MKYFLFPFFFVLGIWQNSFSQYYRFVQSGKNLYEIKQQVDAQLLPDTAEGSEYAEYIKFLNFWEPRLFPHGDFAKYLKGELQNLKKEIEQLKKK